jgi:hypothetical protein
MMTWLDMFRDTITCPSCKSHFTDLLASYRKTFPNMLQNQHEFVVFTFRAHNAVNRRLNKPIYTSVDECLATLRNVTKTRRAKDYRTSYLNHITRYWRIMQDVSGIIALKKIQEMKRIEFEYVSARDTNFTGILRADVVVLPHSVLEKSTETQVSRPYVYTGGGGGGFRITTQGLRLRR